MNLKFSRHENPAKSKTKCLVFSKKPRERQNVLPVNLAGVPLPWVSQVKHLGNMLQQDNSMKVDICQKRGKFIGIGLSVPGVSLRCACEAHQHVQHQFLWLQSLGYLLC